MTLNLYIDYPITSFETKKKLDQNNSENPNNNSQHYLTIKLMINYNNNYQNSTFQQTVQSDLKPQQSRLPLHQLQFQQINQNFNQPQNLQEIEPIAPTPPIEKNNINLQAFEDIEHIQYFEPQKKNKIVIHEEKQTEKIEKDNIIKEDHTHPRHKFNLQNVLDQVNQQITASHRSESNLSKSNLSSQSESIHSNQRYWRLAKNKKQENKDKKDRQNNKVDNSFEKKQKQEQNKKIQNNWVKSSYKYLFYAPQIIEEKVKEVNKNQAYQIIKKNQILFVKSPQQKRTQYVYQKGKKKQGESTKDRLNCKFGVILNTFEDSNEIASVSYYSQNKSELHSQHNRESKEIKKQPQQKLIMQSPKKMKDTVIFVGEPQEQQLSIHNFEIEENQIIKNKSSSKNLVENEQKQTLTEHKNSKNQNITPKDTINLDKSFKSHSPKSQILVKSLDQSKSNNATIKTPISKRRNSFDQIQQILTEIQQKQLNLKKIVSFSIKSNKNQNEKKEDQQIQFHTRRKNSTKSALFKSSRYDLNDQGKKLIQQPKRYAQRSVSNKSKNPMNASSQSVKVNQVDLKITPTSSRLMNKQNSKENSFSSQGNKQKSFFQNINHLQVQKIKERQHQPQHEQFQKLDNVKQQQQVSNTPKIIAPFFKANGKQEQFIDEEMGSKQKRKIKQLKQPVKKLKNTHLKTVQKYQIDQGELISQFLPKNKVQFKIDSSRKLKTQLSEKPIENKKILALLKRRQQALARKIRQMNQINPKTFLFPESSSGTGVSKQSSLRSNELNSNLQKISSLNSKNIENNDGKNMIQNQITVKRKETANIEGSFFPTLNMRPQLEKLASNTFYIDNQGSKVRMIRENRINTERRRQNELSNNSSDKQVTFYESNKIPSSLGSIKVTNKVQFSNLNKVKKQQKASHKNTSAKQKYQRLRLLLGQN